MILTAWPEIDDQRDAALFVGPAGALLDAMLRAIGTTRDACYRARLAVTRPPGGRCDQADTEELARPLRHHLKLARPQRLLLVAGQLVRLAAGTAPPTARARALEFTPVV